VPRRSLTALVAAPPHCREIVDREGRVHISVARLACGIGEGRTLVGPGNTSTQWWLIHSSGAAFDACTAHDPLRFTNPLVFKALKAEVSHVADATTAREPSA
jgi:hypothetical protein